MLMKNMGKICFVLLSIFLAVGQFAQEPLHYDMAVTVKVVPIFAVDAKGEPVYDLTEDELELFVNGSAVSIADFQRYTVDEVQEEEVEAKRGQTAPKSRKQTERVVFIIMDSIFNSQYGWRRSKEFARNLILDSPAGDTFILLESTPAGGLKYHGTGREDRVSLINTLKKLKMPYEKWSRDIFQSREYDQFTDFGLQSTRASGSGLQGMGQNQLNNEQMRYQSQIKHFSRSLAQLQYALNTITRPKIVFLISEGIAKGAFNLLQSELNLNQQARAASRLRAGQQSSLLIPEKTVADTSTPLNSRFYKYLKDVVQAINRGGSVLYAINPARVIHDDENKGDLSLMTLAGESGGRYFAGSDVDIVIREVRKTTAAYYELAFPLRSVSAREMDIEVKCRRKGVRIHSINHAEKENPYARMEPLRKKLFALDVINGGNWSRIVGKVVRLNTPAPAVKKVGQKTFYQVAVNLPRKMQNCYLDVFTLSIDPETQKVDVRLAGQTFKKSIDLRVQARQNRRLYFVIVEPQNTYCLYNQIES